ncbi:MULTISPECIES: helix-turn-helix domain-containing protein [Actinomadura]|uniref:Scr1 family TA system antitoxin-like transcriptional regulator n=1 Tax=Actinomadura yumaensis TaxID=111807 RepID=A0ABW2C9F7_9ACTN|nr:helix-turn-helix transcriptional regulator [Actinomadura sp. J1-007]MWK33834.1 helix-turn-helix domain-containing protein [Actinomadura sp. J1-007]
MSVRESIDPKSSLWAWLAFDLWFYRTQRGLSLAQTAMIVQVTRGTVSNWEAGRLRPRDTYMKRLDEKWNTGGHFERLHMFACNGHDPDWYKQYLQYERAATNIEIYHGKTIPAVLQTEAYTRALVADSEHGIDVAKEIDARLKRQEILARDDPPYLWVLLDQEVLECAVGGPDVMREQLAYLVEVGRLPRVTIRIIPRSAGRHPGHDGAIQILRVSSREVAYVGAQLGGRLIEGGDETAALALRFAQIGAVALSKNDSRSWIEKTMRAYASDQLA